MSNTLKTITLVMIVKNESKVIQRCFDSVKDYIDHWVICDTGSTDGTQDIIKKYFEDAKIPGNLHKHKWVNFGFNRSLAISLAKGKSDYSLLLDADFIFKIKDKNFKNTLISDGYQIKYEGSLDYRQMLFVKSSFDWKYVGVTHEYLTCPSATRYENLDAFTIDHLCDGGSRSDKFVRDIELLTKGIIDEPKNHRYMFYLAQSHKDVGNYTDAIKYYEMRVSFGEWPEEVYFSLFQIGYCKMMRGDKYPDIRDAYLKAYKYRPERLEALHELVKYCRLHNMSDLGFNYGMPAVDTKYPKDILFISKPVHEWMLLDEVALCAYNLHKSEISIKLYDKFLKKGYDGVDNDTRIKTNYNFFQKQALEDKLRKENENNKLNKVAIILVNYNMKERADSIIDNLRKTVKQPYDVILVDNGSDLIEESKHTSLKLQKNVQTTNGWLMGLHYADSLEVINNEKYFAYCFVITSAKLVETEKDIISTMVQTMKEDNDVVGVHPSLTPSSTTHWKHLINTPDKCKEHVYFVDNIFSCYRASWFNKIKRFNPKLTYAWGIDIETGYFADVDRKKIVLDNSIQVEKETDIGYKMNRMKMSSIERIHNASKQIDEYFIEKYGVNYKKLLYRKLDFKCDYTNNSSNIAEQIYLLPISKYIVENNIVSAGKTLVEIGSTRSLTEQDSTYHLATFCNANKIHFITVDVDEDSYNVAKQRLENINPTFQAILSKGEDFLKIYNKKIDFLYLDGFDFYHEYHSTERKDKYKKYLNLEITNENCWNMHLECVKNYIVNNTGTICINNVIDDSYNHKGKLAVPYLLDNNYKIYNLQNNSIILDYCYSTNNLGKGGIGATGTAKNEAIGEILFETIVNNNNNNTIVSESIGL